MLFVGGGFLVVQTALPENLACWFESGESCMKLIQIMYTGLTGVRSSYRKSHILLVGYSHTKKLQIQVSTILCN
jgi:hypothetical protein